MSRATEVSGRYWGRTCRRAASFTVAVAAAGFAIFYVRNTGKKTRASREAADNTKNNTEEILEEAVEKARRVIEDAKLGGAWW